MIYQIHQPAFPLSLGVDNIVVYEGYAPPHHKERLLPDGGIDLVINLTPSPKNLYDNTDFSRFTAYKKAWVSGIRKEFITIDAGDNSSMMVIRFKPGTASVFFNFPLFELSNAVVEMDAIWDRDFFHLREHLLEQPDPQARIMALEKWLLQRMKPEAAPHPVVEYALSLIHRRPHLLTIADIQQKTGFSNKHFIHLFEKHVGATPKTYLRIMKFQRVLTAIEQARHIQWTDVAYSCGYYDQAHFIKEFRQFSGFNPGAYLLERGEYLNYLPIKNESIAAR